LEEKLSIEILNNIHNHIGNELPNKRKKLLFTIAAAASIILCLSIGSYFIFHKQVPLQYAFTQKSDILPGGNKAILILADGKKIFLTDANNGLLAKQEDALIRKTKDGGSSLYCRTIRKFKSETRVTLQHHLNAQNR
jgi:hypothetical protein